MKTIIDIGDSVLCDYCAKEYRGSPATGGFLFLSKAVCPECAPAALKRIKGYGEERFIRGHCPEGMTFHAWVMELRGGDNRIQILTGDDVLKL